MAVELATYNQVSEDGSNVTVLLNNLDIINGLVDQLIAENTVYSTIEDPMMLPLCENERTVLNQKLETIKRFRIDTNKITMGAFNDACKYLEDKLDEAIKAHTETINEVKHKAPTYEMTVRCNDLAMLTTLKAELEGRGYKTSKDIKKK